MRQPPISRVLVVSVCAWLAGCVGTPGPPVVAAPSTAVVVVHNSQLEDVHVYAVRGSSRIRMGVVSSLSERSLRVLPHMLGGHRTLVLMAETRPSRDTAVTQPLLLFPGARASWWLAPSLSLSRVTIAR